MERRVNFRSFVFSTALLIITVLCCVVALNIPFLGAPLLIVTVAFPTVFAIIKRKKTARYIFVTMIMTTILCFVAIICFFVMIYAWVPSEIESGQYGVSGTVEDNIYVDGARKVILKDVELDGFGYKGRMQIAISDEENIFGSVAIGDRLSFDAYVNVRAITEGFTVRADYFRSNIRYTAKVDSSNVAIGRGKLTLLDEINAYVKGVLTDGMGEHYGAIAYGMLTGDKNEISASVRESFSGAGIAHILAVSGLHIGFLAGAITFILRKCKVKRLPTFIVCAVVLLLYDVFAGFSPSVVRATIMFLTADCATLLGKRSDGLNSLGLASTVILTFSPLMLFEAGFLMSVGAVFGIICFEPIITGGLTRIRLPEKLARAVAVPLSAQIGVVPTSALFFGELPVYAVLANIVLMPLMSFIFIALFVCLIISLISTLPLTLLAFALKGLTIAAEFVSGLPGAQIELFEFSGLLLIYPVYFVVSGFVNIKHKALTVGISAASIIVLLVVLAVI